METTATEARRLVRAAAEELERAGVPEPVASAEFLLAELLGVGRAELFAGRVSLSDEELAGYGDYISRRKRREPVQRILGYAYFRHLRLGLDGAALIPRQDTESVVDAALEAIDRRGSDCRVLDLGTGSGAIAISISHERPRCEVHATDASKAALEAARANANDANANAAGAEVRFHCGDLFFGLEELHGKVSVLVSNPPYVARGEIPNLEPEVRDWDPHTALDGGPDGLSFYRRIFDEAGPLLVDGADLILEVGDGQAEPVLELGRRAGYAPLGTHEDLTGAPRAALLRWPE